MEHYSVVFHFTAVWLPRPRKGEGEGFPGLRILLDLLPLCRHTRSSHKTMVHCLSGNLILEWLLELSICNQCFNLNSPTHTSQRPKKGVRQTSPMANHLLRLSAFVFYLALTPCSILVSNQRPKRLQALRLALGPLENII